MISNTDVAVTDDVLYLAPFTILGGATDYLLGCLAVGGKGAITGMSNVAPRACAKVYELFLAGKQAEALSLAGEISKAEWGMGKGGILGTKVCRLSLAFSRCPEKL